MFLPFVVGPQLDRLHKDLKKSQRAAYAVGTRSNLLVQWKSFLLFCSYFQLFFCPASHDTICLFAQFLSRSFKSVQSIKNYINGVKLLHMFLDAPLDTWDSFQLKLALKGLARLKPHLPKRALPITPPILLQFLPHLDLTTPSDAAYWCLFLFAFFLMARKSNLVPKAALPLSQVAKVLKRKDVLQRSHTLLVSISWSKTIQFGERRLSIPLLAAPHSPLCPVTAFRRMCRLCPAQPEAPLFVIPSPKGSQPITYPLLQNKLKFLIAASGRDPNQFSSHSFRRGGATWAFRSIVPIDLIQLHGDWRSDAYKLYLEYNLQDRAQVSQAMLQHLPS